MCCARSQPRERRVIQLRFGLGDGHQRALDEVARRLGTSRETVRQLERQALQKLRRTGHAKLSCALTPRPSGDGACCLRCFCCPTA